MPDLRKARTKLQITVGALVILDVAAVVLLLTPYAGSEASRKQQMRQLWLDLKSRETAPWRGLDKKIPQAKQEIADFYRDRFPAGYSEISNSVDKIASESGVKIASEKYDQKDADLEGVQRVEVQADVSGDYLQLVRFINTLERSKVFFIVRDLQLGGEQNGQVKLQIKFETYLRSV
ncbi:MAG TPA: GspMb/PilO family protein [Terriglobales bacterium]|jgi:type IV pilus assembly protein PilO